MNMKKYTKPQLQIVLLEEVDVVTSSFSGIGGETEEWDARERRNAIWDE